MSFKTIKHKVTENISRVLTKLGIAEHTRNSFIKYFYNTGWMFAEKVLVMIVAFFVGVYVARYLGPAKYGLLNYALSYVMIFKAFFKLGLDGIVVRNLVQKPGDKLKILGTTFGLKLIGGLIGFILILISIYYSNNDFETKLMVFIIAGGMIFSCFEVGQFFFESQVKAKFNAMALSVAVLMSSGVKLYLIITQSDLLWFAFAYFIELSVQSIGFILFYIIKNKDILKWNFNKTYAISLFKNAFPLMLSSMAAMLYLKIDQLMIKDMMGPEAVGKYSAAVKISELWYFIPVVINNSLFPALINAKNHSERFYYKRLQQLFNLLVWTSIAIAFAVSFLSPFIIETLFGIEYIEASSVLIIHIWSGIFIFMNNALIKWQIAENKLNISLISTVIGASMNIGLNFIFIDAYGILGAAWTSLISYAFVGYFNGLLFKPMRKLFKIQTNALIFKSVFISKYKSIE